MAVSTSIALLLALFTGMALSLVRQARERQQQQTVFYAEGAGAGEELETVWEATTPAIAATATEATQHLDMLLLSESDRGRRHRHWPDRTDERGRHSSTPVYPLPVERVWEGWYYWDGRSGLT